MDLFYLDENSKEESLDFDINIIPETIKINYYPNDFSEFIIDLLIERLKLLNEIKYFADNWSEKKRHYFKICLERNELMIGNNVSDEEFCRIFKKPRIDHMNNAELFLLERFGDDQFIQEKLKFFIEKYD